MSTDKDELQKELARVQRAIPIPNAKDNSVSRRWRTDGLYIEGRGGRGFRHFKDGGKNYHFMPFSAKEHIDNLKHSEYAHSQGEIDPSIAPLP